MPGTQRFLKTAGQTIERLTLAVAAWLVFLRGHADDGTRYDISDPMAARLTASVPTDPEQLVETMPAIKEVFPPELANREDFRRRLVDAVRLLQHGARQAIAIERD
ncbi:mannitol-1-phosphate/altronate dehydrogenase [Paraburkholderia hospita]|uniref:mannitol dehydrogenase family protein n=1 Tax=Paraburkholderia hospita TaxID=169430 RepID=UPI000271D843|nr:mannitol-1-phosphate/altronate dehydrogenase [Paraburkholderia hospita]EUC13972.1 Mannitol dehydrogenase domain-containing protein [Burkholderia sp. BT03]